MGVLGSLTSGGGGGGGGASSSATSGANLGSDSFNYGSNVPAAPPGLTPVWLLPSIIGAVALVALLLVCK